MSNPNDDEGSWASKTISVTVSAERRFYDLTDHPSASLRASLGNVRATVKENGEMVSKDAYRSRRNL